MSIVAQSAVTNGQSLLASCLENVQNTDPLTIVAVPPGVLFRTAVDEKKLMSVSCQYKFKGNGAYVLEVIKHILLENVYSNKAGNVHEKRPDLRIGVLFKKVHIFLEDFAGKSDVGGLYQNQYFLSKGSASVEIKKLITREEFDLIETNNQSCVFYD